MKKECGSQIPQIPRFQTIDGLNRFLSEGYEYGWDGMTVKDLVEDYGRMRLGCLEAYGRLSEVFYKANEAFIVVKGL
ncbi:MAG: hypothetical protein K6T66_15715 [Peptococcaceae bacterium]|nr:hypothetical protein [Peptococcaceae bacterium]